MTRRKPEMRGERFSNRVLAAYAAAGLQEQIAIVDATADTPVEILLYDEIGYWGVNASDFAKALAEAGSGPLTLRINSPGGDVFDGYAIYNMLKARAAPVNVIVDGIAASAASYIAMAGSTVTMNELSMLMIHNAGGLCFGDRNDMTDMAGVLAKIDGQIAAIYATKSGKTVEEMAAAMDAETWYTSTDAKAIGLADAIADKSASNSAKNARPIDRTGGRGADGLLDQIPQKPTNAATTPEWMCSAAEDLPIDAKSDWDGPAATERMLDAAGFNGDSPDPAKAKVGFLAWDHHNPKLKGSYKLPFADVVEGKLTALKSGIDAAASRLPDTDAPDSVKTSARSVLDAYETRLKPADDKAANRSRLMAQRLRLAEAEAA